MCRSVSRRVYLYTVCAAACLISGDTRFKITINIRGDSERAAPVACKPRSGKLYSLPLTDMLAAFTTKWTQNSRGRTDSAADVPHNMSVDAGVDHVRYF